MFPLIKHCQLRAFFSWDLTIHSEIKKIIYKLLFPCFDILISCTIWQLCTSKLNSKERKWMQQWTSYFIILQIGILTLLVSRILSIQSLFIEKFINASSTSKQLASRQSSTLVSVFQMKLHNVFPKLGGSHH